MSEEINKLIEIIQYIVRQQQIMTKILIHFGFRADLYDNFIRECFNELENLTVPKELEEADK